MLNKKPMKKDDENDELRPEYDPILGKKVTSKGSL
jgi:hypothetical protein